MAGAIETFGAGQDAPRSAHRLIADTLVQYRRYPLLFFILAAAVIVPYQAILLVATGTGPFGGPSLPFPVSLLLSLLDLGLITPLVSALHVHAVAEAGNGETPKLAPIARKGLRVLPVVGAASLISWLGIVAGLVALIVPGVILLLRWAVVAQTAAIDHDGWRPALRHSDALTDGQYRHVFGLLIYVFLITDLPILLLGFVFGHDPTTASILIGTVAQVVVQSFAALATALLYFDLRVRWDLLVKKFATKHRESHPRPSATSAAPRSRTTPLIRANTPTRIGRGAGTSTPTPPCGCVTGTRAIRRPGRAPPRRPGRSARFGPRRPPERRRKAGKRLGQPNEPDMDTAAMRARRRQRWVARAERVRDAFGLVFMLVLLTYVLASLLDNHGWEAVILTVATSATSVVALTSSHAKPGFVRAAIWLSALTVGFAALAAVTDDRTWLNFATVIQIVLLAVAMGAVLKRVVTTAEVGSRTILGAISVYTVLGMLFTFLYGFVDRLQGPPFFEGVAHPQGSDFLFFSYTTLTTTGYGNLVASGQPGRMISGLEMMIGQIFLVTLVAGLVSLWRPGDALRRRQEAKRAGSLSD